jgi:hypothetical protein
MKKFIFLLVVGIPVFSIQTAFAQVDELAFIEIRQEFADSLTAVKNAVKANDWLLAQQSFDRAKKSWESDVKPIIVKGRKEEIEKARQAGVENPESEPGKLKEYSDRIGAVEENLGKIAQFLTGQKGEEIEPTINATIWEISHQPRGFDIPHRTYSVWDWVFGLGIGLGFCAFAVVTGLYLRRSYYRRYRRLEL